MPKRRRTLSKHCSTSAKLPTTMPLGVFNLKSFLLMVALVCPATLLQANADNQPQSWADSEIPEVLSATRLRQASADVPGSITVITAEMIKASGAREIPEVLRLAPGMVIAKRSGHNFQVSYHGTSVHDNRRMEVLIDGRSVYQPAIASVSWSDLPVLIDDIERIEIVRGPNTALYGSNAFLGVINIITRHPVDSEGLRVTVRHGRPSVEDYSAIVASSNKRHSLKASFKHQEDSGFDRQPETGNRRDSKFVDAFNIHLSSQLSAQHTLDLQLGASSAQLLQEQDEDDYMLSGPILDNESYYATARSTYDFNANQQLQTKLYHRHHSSHRHWDVCGPGIVLSSSLRDYFLAFPEDTNNFVNSLLSGGQLAIPADPQAQLLQLAVLTEIADRDASDSLYQCGTAYEGIEQQRNDLELQYTWAINQRHRLVAGINLREDYAKSANYFDGHQSNTSSRAFFNLETRPLQPLVINLAGIYEHESDVEANLKPRLAINLQATEQLTWRGLYSEATRSPDMFENHARWAYTVKYLTPSYQGLGQGDFYAIGIGPGDLEHEQVKSWETGIQYRLPRYGLLADIKWFYDEFDQLISELHRSNQFRPSNQAYLNLQGYEAQLDINPSRYLLFRAVMSRINAKTNVSLEKTLTPEDSFSLLMAGRTPSDFQVSIAYYNAWKIRSATQSRGDLRVAKAWPLTQGELELSTSLQHYFVNDPVLLAENSYEHKTNGYITISYRY